MNNFFAFCGILIPLEFFVVMYYILLHYRVITIGYKKAWDESPPFICATIYTVIVCVDALIAVICIFSSILLSPSFKIGFCFGTVITVIVSILLCQTAKVSIMLLELRIEMLRSFVKHNTSDDSRFLKKILYLETDLDSLKNDIIESKYNRISLTITNLSNKHKKTPK